MGRGEDSRGTERDGTRRGETGRGETGWGETGRNGTGQGGTGRDGGGGAEEEMWPRLTPASPCTHKSSWISRLGKHPPKLRYTYIYIYIFHMNSLIVIIEMLLHMLAPYAVAHVRPICCCTFCVHCYDSSATCVLSMNSYYEFLRCIFSIHY